MAEVLAAVGKIPRYVWYILAILVLLIPLFAPMKLPIQLSPSTQNTYDIFQSLDGTESRILFCIAYSPTFWGELQHVSFAYTQHMFYLEDVKVVFAPLGSATAIPLLSQTLQSISNPLNKEYGVDYVVLPLQVGLWEAIFAGLTEDFRGQYTVDDTGVPIDELPAMDGVNTLDDFDVIIWIEAARYTYLAARFFYPAYPNKIYVSAVIAEAFMLLAPYYGNVYQGAIWGTRQAAEYQQLFGGPYTDAIVQMDALTAYSLLALVALILGNVAVLGERMKRGGT